MSMDVPFASATFEPLAAPAPEVNAIAQTPRRRTRRKARAVKPYRPIKYTPHDKERQHSPDNVAPDDERTVSERDRSRIIHSAAFRRLQGKTQVFTAGEGDFFRTRLTHSLEVAQIAKGLALRLGADTDLVETAALIHDIGHPPFGHAGEATLKELMTDYGGFEANAQNVRILSHLERKESKYAGLNLTRAVIDAHMKYKVHFPNDRDKFIYAEDVGTMRWASHEARNMVSGLDEQRKSFECEIMDWADQVAYAVHDLEDSIHAHYIEPKILLSLDHPRVRAAIDEVVCKYKHADVDVPKVYVQLINDLRDQDDDLGLLGAANSLQLQKANRKKLTSFLIGRYIKAAVREERPTVSDDPVSRRYQYSVQIPIECEVEVALINRMIKVFVFHSPQVRTLEEKGKYIIRSLFQKFMDANGTELLPDDWKEYLPRNDYSESDKLGLLATTFPE